VGRWWAGLSLENAPRGRIVEIFGPESSGKTTLVPHVIAEAQRRGGICALIDAEHEMDPQYALNIGVNVVGSIRMRSIGLEADLPGIGVVPPRMLSP